MAGTARAVVIVVFVVSAGCVGFTGHSFENPLAGYAGDPDNPYPSGNLTVAIDSDGADRPFAPLVYEAAAYWEAHDERYLNYSVNVTVAPNASDPDIQASFVPALSRCGQVEHAAGCSPKVTNPTQTVDTVDVRVLDNLSNASTVHVLKHEFGHALGLGHGDPPQDVMAAHATLQSVPQLNASERTLAWDDPMLSVYLVNATAADRKEIDDALAFYDRGANGTVLKNVSFHRTQSMTEADVVVRFAERSPCGPGSGSCGSVFGTDPDGDGALERYRRVDITIADLDTEVVGWHVARWLGLGFGMENESEYPPTLRAETTHAHRAGEWWR